MSYIDNRWATTGPNGEIVWRERPKANPIVAKLREAHAEIQRALEECHEDEGIQMVTEVCKHGWKALARIEEAAVLLGAKIEEG